MINFLRRLFCIQHEYESEQSILDDEWVEVCRKCNKEKK